MGFLRKILLSNKTYKDCLDALPTMSGAEVSDYFSRVLKTRENAHDVSDFIREARRNKVSLKSLTPSQIDEYYTDVLRMGDTGDCLVFLQNFNHPKNEVLIDSVLDNGFDFQRTTVLEKVLPIDIKNKKTMEKRMDFVKMICSSSPYHLTPVEMVQDELNIFVPALVKSNDPEECLRALMFRKDLSKNKQKVLVQEAEKASDTMLYTNAIKCFESGKSNIEPAYAQILKDNFDEVVKREEENKKMAELMPTSLFDDNFENIFNDDPFQDDDIFGNLFDEYGGDAPKQGDDN